MSDCVCLAIIGLFSVNSCRAQLFTDRENEYSSSWSGDSARCSRLYERVISRLRDKRLKNTMVLLKKHQSVKNVNTRKCQNFKLFKNRFTRLSLTNARNNLHCPLLQDKDTMRIASLGTPDGYCIRKERKNKCIICCK
ncbi:uncharacterized protein LOC124357559 isoform X1 [Homalodisca vitripennis]|uniref:uncharacterized protein LOC124357559 isoform X1 n=1 Tax=Homalodisca vitripennis TaxID=197043 RepID=UPI001EE9C196|nr:uncharacterized protein LOC124357559 isoform X1 [Homalodisca vitripennis]